jgi:hypothetical protein
VEPRWRALSIALLSISCEVGPAAAQGTPGSNVQAVPPFSGQVLTTGPRPTTYVWLMMSRAARPTDWPTPVRGVPLHGAELTRMVPAAPGPVCRLRLNSIAA